MVVLAGLPGQAVFQVIQAAVGFIILVAHYLVLELMAVMVCQGRVPEQVPQDHGLVIVVAVAVVPVFVVVEIQPLVLPPVMVGMVAGMAAQVDQHPGRLQLEDLVTLQIPRERAEERGEVVAHYIPAAQ